MDLPGRLRALSDPSRRAAPSRRQREAPRHLPGSIFRRAPGITKLDQKFSSGAQVAASSRATKSNSKGRAIGTTFPFETTRRRAPPRASACAAGSKIRGSESGKFPVVKFTSKYEGTRQLLSSVYGALSKNVRKLRRRLVPLVCVICTATAMTPVLYHMNHNTHPRWPIKPSPSPWPPSKSSAAPRAWCQCRQSPPTRPRALPSAA